jgi:general L-amino acid transport system permease protein
VLYIELIRGVPLITLLFMGRFALGFFLPPGMDSPPPVITSSILFTLFSAAYVAEIVRGGLQSVPSGQTEAGQAVGLSPLTITRRIVLPQALRNAIPALVGQVISLLTDTTLLVIIGQFDLLGVSDPILASPAYQNQGYAPEVYAFVAFMFWIMCFSMSRASQRLETKLGVGTR